MSRFPFIILLALLLMTSCLDLVFAQSSIQLAQREAVPRTLPKQPKATNKTLPPGSKNTLNPQPLPPGSKSSLNPQPLPPGSKSSLNPQPLPPGAKSSLSPQPLPPGSKNRVDVCCDTQRTGAGPNGPGPR